ncbi:uncharacterized protein N7458_004872 [Penicillium daleae]|uniref:Uncharacterized protein n=1 Tax=Penicillium daleae TaxID=63821 RepID=A0AAD6C6V9_9EURO|nr:uncharacterized protein N7458_004872 [Penicillium daleae]KAJ5453916.1 hypothetical protein N7458_004872 [Penicillium daleae]
MVLPKKVLPQSPRIKEMGFVEKAGITLEEFQETFIARLNYETQTRASRTIPDARLFARGVYSITSAQHGSYLAYLLIDPEILVLFRRTSGFKSKEGGWFTRRIRRFPAHHLSVFLTTQGILEGCSFDKLFGNHRWVALQPKLIDYPNAQFLLIEQCIRQDFSAVPGGRHESMDTLDKQLDELRHWSDEMEKSQLGFDSIYGDLGLEVDHHLKISTVKIKDAAHRGLFDSGYEREWFSTFETKPEAMEELAASEGTGLAVYAVAWDGTKFRLRVSTSPNDLELTTDSKDGRVVIPLYYVVQTNVPYCTHERKPTHDTHIEEVFKSYIDARKFASTLLLSEKDRIKASSYQEYTEADINERDCELGENVVVHAVGGNEENYFVSVVTGQELESVRLEASLKI